MTIKSLREKFVTSLSGTYDSDEILSFFYILTAHILQLRRVDIALQLDTLIKESEVSDFMDAIQGLKENIPIQYITATTTFYGTVLKLNKNVLIPRPETEELVDLIIKKCNKEKRNRRLKILDIGTGSGCIAIALAKHMPTARVYGIDISAQAIELATFNANFNNVDVYFYQQDILKTDALEDEYDIIVSNPPYVRALEKKEMQPNVLNHEPHSALFVPDDDPLIFYKKITELALSALKKDGVLCFEINQYLGTETKQMIGGKGFVSVILHKDVFSNDRMIQAYLN